MLLKIRPQISLVSSRAWLLVGAALLAIVGSVPASAQDDASGPVEGELVDFGRDVWPILRDKCLVCHGPEDAKNDFRVDMEDSMSDYVEAGDLESSSLWVDYLITDDVDMRMPPADSDVGSLSGAQLALLKVWIEEGASWGEIPGEEAADQELEPEVPLAESLTDAEKWWRLSGLFHPATIHFPIALLVVSAGFVVLSFINRDAFEPVAFHCLWIGALGAVVASALGWSYAQSEGYGAMSFDLGNSSIDRHRWLGIAAAVVALILIPTARSVRRTGDTGMRMLWMLGSFVAVGAVSIAGYQGGELTYGDDHYLKEYERLFPADAQQQDGAEEVEEVEEADESVDASTEEVAEGDVSDERADTSDGSDGKSDEETSESGDAAEVEEMASEESGNESGSEDEAVSSESGTEDATKAEAEKGDTAKNTESGEAGSKEASGEESSAEEKPAAEKPTEKKPGSEEAGESSGKGEAVGSGADDPETSGGDQAE